MTVNGVTVTPPAGVTINPAFDGNADQVITTGRTLAGGASESYQLVVTANVPLTVPSESRPCQEGPGFGFFNDGTVTTAGLTDSDSACGDIPEPAVPVLAKQGVSVVIGADRASWDVTYTITVTNPTAQVSGTYSLSDTPNFPSGVTINTATATLNGSTVGSWNGTSLIGHGDRQAAHRWQRRHLHGGRQRDRAPDTFGRSGRVSGRARRWLLQPGDRHRW